MMESGYKGRMWYYQHTIYVQIIEPIVNASISLIDFLWTKLGVFVIFLVSSTIFDWHIFSTPQRWWQGLAILIIIDWFSGIIGSIYHKKFTVYQITDKWFQVLGYVACCSMGAILANTFPSILYYVQFFIYLSFFIKEGWSIIKTYGLQKPLIGIYCMLHPGRSIEDIQQIISNIELDRDLDRYQKND